MLPLEMYTCWDEMNQHLGNIMSLCQTGLAWQHVLYGCEVMHSVEHFLKLKAAP